MLYAYTRHAREVVLVHVSTTNIARGLEDLEQFR